MRTPAVLACAALSLATFASGNRVRAQTADAGLAAVPQAGSQAAPEDSPEATDEALPQAHQPEVRMALSPDRVALGQLLKLRIEATVPEGDDVTVAEQDFGSFEVHGRSRTVRPARQGQQTFVFELSLQTFDPAMEALAPIELRVVTTDGFIGRAETPAQAVKLESLLANEPDAKPRAPGQPVSVMQDDYTLLWVLGALLAIALIALLTVLVQRYLRRRPVAEAPPPPPRPPWEIATEKLAQLRRRKQSMLQAGQGVQFVDEVSDAVREYLGGCFGFEGLDTTSEEMLRLLRGRSANPGLQREVGAYLNRCDLVKFADINPDQDEADLIFAKAQDIVQFSTPAGGGAVHGAPIGPATPAPHAEGVAADAPPANAPAPHAATAEAAGPTSGPTVAAERPDDGDPNGGRP